MLAASFLIFISFSFGNDQCAQRREWPVGEECGSPGRQHIVRRHLSADAKVEAGLDQG
jgi:hypothetical protein